MNKFEIERIASEIRLNAPLIIKDTRCIESGFFKQYPELKPEITVQTLGNRLAITLETIINGETLEEKSASYPSNWWEAFKERFFPKWILSRFPVEYTTIKIEARALYPKLSLPKSPNKIVFFVDRKSERKSP